jgi:hypothetical protein
MSAADLVPVLEELVQLAGKGQDKDKEEIVYEVLTALVHLGAAAGERGERLARTNSNHRVLVLRSALSVNPQSVDAVRAVLEEEDRETSTIGEFRGLLNRQSPTANILRPLLQHPTRGVRERAAARLFPLDPTDADAAKILKEAAGWEWGEMSNEFRREGPFVAFAQAGRAGVPHLVELLTSKHPAARALAAVTLARLDPGGTDVVEAAGRVLAGEMDGELWPTYIFAGQDYRKSRRALLAILARAGPEARRWAGAVRGWLTDRNPASVRIAAAEALAAIDPAAKEPVEVLTELLRSDNVHKKAHEEEGYDRVTRFPQWLRGASEDCVTRWSAADFRADVADALFRIDPEAAVRVRAFDRLHKPGAEP